MKQAQHFLNDSAALAQRTFFWERIRSIFTGFIEMIWQPGASVALLVAIRYFEVGATLKSLVAAANPIGFLLTPFSLALFAMMGRPIHQLMSGLFVLTGGLLLIIPFVDQAVVYVLLCVGASLLMSQYIPLYTEMYSRNFTTELRGTRISTVFIIGGAVSVAANLLVGELLDFKLGFYKLVMATGAVCCFASAYCMYQIPSTPLDVSSRGVPWKNLSLAWKDRLFGWLLSAWMLMGFGNLMTLPLRTEYMANPRFGIDASNQTILIVTGAVPLVCRLLSSRLLGKLFDQWNLIHLRILLNSLFLLSILGFFFTKNVWVMAVSMALLGAAMGGGRIAWSLWVTKLAPPDQTSAYMSVHMFMTGLRGTVAPFVGFASLHVFSPVQVSLFGSALVLISIVMFLPARTHLDTRGKELGAAALDPRLRQ